MKCQLTYVSRKPGKFQVRPIAGSWALLSLTHNGRSPLWEIWLNPMKLLKLWGSSQSNNTRILTLSLLLGATDISRCTYREVFNQRHNEKWGVRVWSLAVGNQWMWMLRAGQWEELCAGSSWESQNHHGWKDHQVQPQATVPDDHMPQCHISAVLEHLQGHQVVLCWGWMSSWWDELIFSKFPDVSHSVLHDTVFEWYFFLFQPERIDPSASRQGYDVRSDVWSLGITLVSE